MSTIIQQLLIAEAREFAASWRWQSPDTPGSAHIEELSERLASPQVYAEFRETPEGDYLLDMIEAYEAAFNDDWLPYTIAGLSLKNAREYIRFVSRELEYNTIQEAVLRLREHYSRFSKHCDRSDHPMNEIKLRFSLYEPVDEQGLPIRLTLLLENESTLFVRYQPEYTYLLIGVVASLLVLAVVSLFVHYILPILLALLFFGIMVYNFSIRRATNCKIDKRIGRIDYWRSGIFWSSWDEQRIVFGLSEIKQLEMKRHVEEYGDKFQIYLSLKSGNRLRLSGRNPDFSECHEFAERIRGFLGPEIPLKAVD